MARHVVRDRYLFEVCIESTGSSLKWFRDAFGGGASYAQLVEEARDVPPGADGVVFLPFVDGAKRAPWYLDGAAGASANAPAAWPARIAAPSAADSRIAVVRIGAPVTSALIWFHTSAWDSPSTSVIGRCRSRPGEISSRVGGYWNATPSRIARARWDRV